MRADVNPFAVSLMVATSSLTLLSGCRPNGPATPASNSSQFATLEQKIDFLNRYVTFRRAYETLDFDIAYLNGSSSRVPGPSEWDVRLVATVPASELPAWIPQGKQPLAALPDRQWLDSVPTSLDLSAVSEWYEDGGRTTGIDRQRRIIVYRNLAM